MSKPIIFKFRLYVAGDAQNSTQAFYNLSAFCSTHLLHQHEIDVVDIFKEPGRALVDGIYLTPTLVKLIPLPNIKIVGTLSQPQVLLQALGLMELAA